MDFHQRDMYKTKIVQRFDRNIEFTHTTSWSLYKVIDRIMECMRITNQMAGPSSNYSSHDRNKRIIDLTVKTSKIIDPMIKEVMWVIYLMVETHH